MNLLKKRTSVFFAMMVIMISLTFTPAFAASETKSTSAENNVAISEEGQIKSNKAIGASVAIGIAAGLAAIGMGIAIGKAAEGISRQPEAEGKIRNSLMLGLVFIETAIIYALIVAILVIFVL